MRRLPLLLLLFLATAVQGCGRLRPGNPADEAYVIFTNEALEQASVYASVGGVEGNRIGTVMPGRTDTLLVPRSYIGRGGVWITARLLARRERPTTGSIPMHRGDRLYVRLPSDARQLIVLPADEP